MQRIVFVGGSDAGGFYIGADGKIHRIPGWNPEQLRDVSNSLSALRTLSQVKNPNIASISSQLFAVVQKELGGQIKEGDMVVIG
jgi:hypothetical protein